MRRAFFTAALLLAAAPVQAADLSLSLDEVRTITFAQPVSTIYVGNPAIADIKMVDSRRAFLQGKAFGRTNIVALNQDGNQISNTGVVVMSNRQSSVTLHRGAERVTYACAGGRCEVTPQPGDGKEAFDGALGQIASHQNAARSAAGAALPTQ